MDSLEFDTAPEPPRVVTRGRDLVALRHRSVLGLHALPLRDRVHAAPWTWALRERASDFWPVRNGHHSHHRGDGAPLGAFVLTTPSGVLQRLQYQHEGRVLSEITYASPVAAVVCAGCGRDDPVPHVLVMVGAKVQLYSSVRLARLRELDATPGPACALVMADPTTRPRSHSDTSRTNNSQVPVCAFPAAGGGLRLLNASRRVVELREAPAAEPPALCAERLATADPDGCRVRIWCCRTGEPLQELRRGHHPARLRTLAMPVPGFLLMTTSRGTTHVWRLRDRPGPVRNWRLPVLGHLGALYDRFGPTWSAVQVRHGGDGHATACMHGPDTLVVLTACGAELERHRLTAVNLLSGALLSGASDAADNN